MQNCKQNKIDGNIQLTKITQVLLDKSQMDSPQVKQSLSALFDFLLWAEKKNETMLKEVISHKLMIIVLQKFKQKINLLIGGYILLLGNAKDEGILIMHLLQNHLPDRILNYYLSYLAKLQSSDQEEHLLLLGNYLKAYHRHLTQNTIPLFIQNDGCLLINICCQFFNYTQQITRTSIMNILMNILKLPWSVKLLSYPKVRSELSRWCHNMCRLLRNELKDFDQNLLTTNQEQSEYIIHLINDKIYLWEDLSQLSQQLFAEAFYNEIIIPLIVGSLNTNGVPLFTLKFTLFILNKLIKTIKNLDLINQLGDILFSSQTISYKDNQLATASLKPFNLNKLTIQIQAQLFQQDQINQFKQVNTLFFNIIRSKDSRFLECICLLILNILKQMRIKPKYTSYYIKQLGFGLNGYNTITISEILINQFKAIHSLEINKMVCSLLLFLQPSKYFSEELKYRFGHIYNQQVNQTKRSLQRFQQKLDYITEVFQYDAKTISHTFRFQIQQKSDIALIFNNQFIDNQQQPFYRQIPQTDQNLIRYNIVKSLLLRKLAASVIQDFNDKTFEKYLERARMADARYIKPGQFLKLPLSVNNFRCKLIDEKIEIPNCLLIEDDYNLIIGYLENMQIKIILNIKLKHVTSVTTKKKDKIHVGFQFRKYQSQMEDLIQMKGIALKSIQINNEYFNSKRGKVKQRQINQIMQILKNSILRIPQISLI